MNGLTVVIPSREVSNLVPCLAAVREAEPDVNIIVIDDGLEPWQTRPEDMTGIGVIPGVKPFCFARNCNLGIIAAQCDDVVLLNDDALLETGRGFALLQDAAAAHREMGLISATTNVAGNAEQYPQRAGLRTASRSIAFICVLIPRHTVDVVGLMDERFGGVNAAGERIYGFCDNDYVRRVREAGLAIGIHDGCYVDHGQLRSSFRGDPYAAGDISAGRALYLAKWGDLK